MNIKTFIEEFINASNTYNTEAYLEKWHSDASLDDPSVGQIFEGLSGIKKYFENYFIGYKTQTRLIDLVVINDSEAHIEVEFTGDFPEGKIGGTFDFKFRNDKIASAKADLI